MNKLFTLLAIVVMGVQIWRPIGLPGLRRRSDFWRIAVAAMVVFGLVALLRPE